MRSNQPSIPGCQSFEWGRASHEMLALLLVPILWEEERKQLCLIFWRRLGRNSQCLSSFPSLLRDSCGVEKGGGCARQGSLPRSCSCAVMEREAASAQGRKRRCWGWWGGISPVSGAE